MVSNEDRFKAINDKQAELDEKLEATRQEMQATRLEAQANSEKMMNAVAEMRAKMMEMFRLNRPCPPVMSSPPAGSTVQGRGNVTLMQNNVFPKQGECSHVQERITLRTAMPQPQNPIPADDQYGPFQDHQNQGHLPRPRAEFLEFDYSNPRLWIRRLERYFMLSQTPIALYVDYLTLYLFGRVGVWFEGYLNNLRGGFHLGALY